MKYFLEFVAKALAEYKDEVDVEQVDEDRETFFYIHLNPEDVGRIIGKNGRTIGAIRSVLNSASKNPRHRIHVEVSEEAA